MKFVIAIVTLLGAFSAQAQNDVCFAKAESAGKKAALAYHSESVLGGGYTSLESQEMHRGQLVSVYNLSTETCSPTDENACGSLTIEIVVVGSAPNCKVVRTEIIGEE